MQCRESVQVAFDEVVVPAAHRKNWYANAIDLAQNTDVLPERIVGGMIQDCLIKTERLMRGCLIGRAQRKMHDVVVELWPRNSGRCQIQRKPEQPVSQLGRATGRIEAVKV